MSITVYRLDNCVKRAVKINKNMSDKELNDVYSRQSLLLKTNSNDTHPNKKSELKSIKVIQMRPKPLNNDVNNVNPESNTKSDSKDNEEHPHVVNACYGLIFLIIILSIIVYMIIVAEEYKKAYLHIQMPSNNTFEGHQIMDNDEFKKLADEMDVIRSTQFKLMKSSLEKEFSEWKLEMQKKANKLEMKFKKLEKIFNFQAKLRRKIRDNQAFSLTDPRTKMNIVSNGLFYGSILFYFYFGYKSTSKLLSLIYSSNTDNELEFNIDGSIKKKVTWIMKLFGVGLPTATLILILSFAFDPDNVMLDDTWQCNVFTSCD